jgi:hypothetical protein
LLAFEDLAADGFDTASLKKRSISSGPRRRNSPRLRLLTTEEANGHTPELENGMADFVKHFSYLLIAAFKRITSNHVLVSLSRRRRTFAGAVRTPSMITPNRSRVSWLHSVAP